MIYFLPGVNTEGYRDILGFYIYPTESATNWNEILNDLKSRGLERINIKDLCMKIRISHRGQLLEEFKKIYNTDDKKRILAFLDFPEAIRKQIYTNNWIERLIKYCSEWSFRKLKGFSLCQNQLIDILNLI